MLEMWVQSLGWEDLLEKEMATHTSIPAWETHGQRSLAGCSLWGCKESDTSEKLKNNNINRRDRKSLRKLVLDDTLDYMDLYNSTPKHQSMHSFQVTWIDHMLGHKISLGKF